MPSRRRALAMAAGLLGLAGCVGDEPGAESSPSASSTPSQAASATPTRTPVKTNTCEDQPITPNIEVKNERLTEQRVSVAVVELPPGTVDEPGGASATPTQTPMQSATPRPDAETLFEAEYVVDAGETFRENEHVYRGAHSESHDYRFDCTLDGETASLPIRTVVENPTLYGVHVSIRDDGPELWTVHGDPGESYNPNCY